MGPLLCIVVLTALTKPSHQNASPTFKKNLTERIMKEGIKENTAVNTIIGYLSCNDPEGDRVVYGSEQSEYLKVTNKTTGEVSLAKKLDKEVQNKSIENKASFKVIFTCGDLTETGAQKPSAATASVTVDITILDVNDMTPTFSSVDGFTFNVSESEQPGYILSKQMTVTDDDYSDPNSQVQTVKLQCNDTEEQEGCELFQLILSSSAQGLYYVSIQLKAKLDFEKDQSYNLHAIAIDNGIESQRTGSISLRIKVEDSQDSDPVFLNDPTNFQVSEKLGVDTVIAYELSARDMDFGNPRKLDFKILDNPDGPNFFETGNVTCQPNYCTAKIKVKSEIDREALNASEYKFIAKVTEKDKTGALTTATATQEFSVTVTDINDNGPLFSKSVYNVSISENFKEVINIYVQDRDEEGNNAFELILVRQTFEGAFGFIPQDNAAGSWNFKIFVNNSKLIDYENPSYRSQAIDLLVIERNTPEQYSSTAVIYVTVTDVNDNDPQFDSENYEHSMDEMSPLGTYILTLSASDVDSGSNGEISYSLSDEAEQLFKVDNKTGDLTLIGQLDYENRAIHVFRAFANNINRVAEVFVTIRVNDINEQNPMFTQDNYTTEMVENSLNFLVPISVQATHPSATITYRILSGNTVDDAFVLNKTTGKLSLQKSISYDQTPNLQGRFVLTVEATDDGKPQRSAQTEIYVTVRDLNNNKPIFNPTTYSVNIPETVQGETFLLAVSATDADYGSNKDIKFRIEEDKLGNFEMKDNEVYTVKNLTLDYDAYQKLEIKIIAVDNGSPQNTATANLTVILEDTNNKAPSFSHGSYKANLDEGENKKGDSVIQLSATDPDPVYSLKYSILPETIKWENKEGMQIYLNSYNATGLFEVNRDTGLITIAQSGPGLNYDYVAFMQFIVQVEDVLSVTGRQTNNAFVMIFIKGKPKTELYFDQPWTKDSPIYNQQIPESSAIGDQVIVLHATDPADNENEVDFYEKVSRTDPNNYFILNSGHSGTKKTGQLLLNKKLDFDQGPKELSVVVQAVKNSMDNLGKRTVTATVIFTVLDTNDNYPQFTQESYSFRISENAEIGRMVGVLTASDIDSPSFGPIEFIMGVGQDITDFILVNGTVSPKISTAELLVNKKLDYERRSTYNLKIIAKDKGSIDSDDLSTTVTVTIEITDENDNKPTFNREDQLLSFSVPETAPEKTQLGQIVAEDGDSGSNGDLLYRLGKAENLTIIPADPPILFEITEISGKLLTKTSLQGWKGSYKMKVWATDRGNPPQSSSINVIIKVQSVEDDDGTPRWILPEEFVVSVTEHNKTKLDIQIKAIARTPNAGIFYSLSGLGDQLNFRIDDQNGDIFVTADLDREIKAIYTLLVEAAEILQPNVLSRRELNVILIDIDDNEPSFEKSNYTACPNDFEVPREFIIPEDTPAYTIVGQAVACDPDGPGNNEMYYEPYRGSALCEENYDAAFEVLRNGSIQSTIPLDYEQKTEHLVCVTVHSAVGMGGKRRKREFDVRQMNETDKVAYIVIKVTDLNDNRPLFPDKEEMRVMETLPPELVVVQVTAIDEDGPQYNGIKYTIESVMYFPPSGKQPYPLKEAFIINPDSGEVKAVLGSYQAFVQGYLQLEVKAFDIKNRMFNDSVTITLVVYQKSNVMKVVLDQTPNQGLRLAQQLIDDLNKEGKKDGKEFFLIRASEHRKESDIVPTQTDICFVVVENKKPLDVSTGFSLLDSATYRAVLNDYKMVDRGTCYRRRTTEDEVKWRDLWWVLVAVAIFIFVCCVILLITIAILYDRYKNYMQTQKTYLVPQ